MDITLPVTGRLVEGADPQSVSSPNFTSCTDMERVIEGCLDLRRVPSELDSSSILYNLQQTWNSAHRFVLKFWIWRPCYLPSYGGETAIHNTIVITLESDDGDPAPYLLNMWFAADLVGTWNMIPLFSDVAGDAVRISLGSWRFCVVDGRTGNPIRYVSIDNGGVVSATTQAVQMPLRKPYYGSSTPTDYEMSATQEGMSLRQGAMTQYCYTMINDYGDESLPSPIGGRTILQTQKRDTTTDDLQDYLKRQLVKQIAASLRRDTPSGKDYTKIRLYRRDALYTDGLPGPGPFLAVADIDITATQQDDDELYSETQVDYDMAGVTSADDIAMLGDQIALINTNTVFRLPFLFEHCYQIRLQNNESTHYYGRYCCNILVDENDPRFEGSLDLSNLLTTSDQRQRRIRFLDSDRCTPLECNFTFFGPLVGGVRTDLTRAMFEVHGYSVEPSSTHTIYMVWGDNDPIDDPLWYDTYHGQPVNRDEITLASSQAVWQEETVRNQNTRLATDSRDGAASATMTNLANSNTSSSLPSTTIASTSLANTPFVNLYPLTRISTTYWQAASYSEQCKFGLTGNSIPTRGFIACHVVMPNITALNVASPPYVVHRNLMSIGSWDTSACMAISVEKMTSPSNAARFYLYFNDGSTAFTYTICDVLSSSLSNSQSLFLLLSWDMSGTTRRFSGYVIPQCIYNGSNYTAYRNSHGRIASQYLESATQGISGTNSHYRMCFGKSGALYGFENCQYSNMLMIQDVYLPADLAVTHDTVMALSQGYPYYPSGSVIGNTIPRPIFYRGFSGPHDALQIGNGISGWAVHDGDFTKILNGSSFIDYLGVDQISVGDVIRFSHTSTTNPNDGYYLVEKVEPAVPSSSVAMIWVSPKFASEITVAEGIMCFVSKSKNLVWGDSVTTTANDPVGLVRWSNITGLSFPASNVYATQQDLLRILSAPTSYSEQDRNVFYIWHQRGLSKLICRGTQIAFSDDMIEGYSQYSLKYPDMVLRYGDSFYWLTYSGIVCMTGDSIQLISRPWVNITDIDEKILLTAFPVPSRNQVWFHFGSLDSTETYTLVYDVVHNEWFRFTGIALHSSDTLETDSGTVNLFLVDTDEDHLRMYPGTDYVAGRGQLVFPTINSPDSEIASIRSDHVNNEERDASSETVVAVDESYTTTTKTVTLVSGRRKYLPVSTRGNKFTISIQRVERLRSITINLIRRNA